MIIKSFEKNISITIPKTIDGIKDAILTLTDLYEMCSMNLQNENYKKIEKIEQEKNIYEC